MRKIGRTGAARAAMMKSGNVTATHNVKKSGNAAAAAIAIAALALATAVAGCDLAPQGSKGSTASLFAVDSKNGNVYEIDETAPAAAGAPPRLRRAERGGRDRLLRRHRLRRGRELQQYGSPGSTASTLRRHRPRLSAWGIASARSTPAWFRARSATSPRPITAAPTPTPCILSIPLRRQPGWAPRWRGAPAGFFPPGYCRGWRARVRRRQRQRQSAAPERRRRLLRRRLSGVGGRHDGPPGRQLRLRRRRRRRCRRVRGQTPAATTLAGTPCPVRSISSPRPPPTARPRPPVLSGVGAGRLAAFGDKTLVATNYGATYIVSLAGAPLGDPKSSAPASPSAPFDAAVRGRLRLRARRGQRALPILLRRNGRAEDRGRQVGRVCHERRGQALRRPPRLGHEAVFDGQGDLHRLSRAEGNGEEPFDEVEGGAVQYRAARFFFRRGRRSGRRRGPAPRRCRPRPAPSSGGPTPGKPCARR